MMARDIKELHDEGTRAELEALIDVLRENATYDSAQSIADNVRGAIIDLEDKYEQAKIGKREYGEFLQTVADERDNARAALQLVQSAFEDRTVEYNEATTTVGKLYAMVQRLAGLVEDGAGIDAPETLTAWIVKAHASELIGAPPEGDVSAPDYDQMPPIYVVVSAETAAKNVPPVNDD